MSGLPDWVNDRRGAGKQSLDDRIDWLEARVKQLEESLAQVARHSIQFGAAKPEYPQWNQPARMSLATGAPEHC